MGNKENTRDNNVGSATDQGRRKFLKHVGAAGAAATVLGAPYVHAATKRIRFLNPETGQATVRALRDIATEYQKKTGVEVVIDTVPIGNVSSKLQASIASGMPYDISGLAFIADVVVLADQGKLVPMNELIARHEWGPNILFPIDGNHYWYPYDYNFNWLYYRKDLYEKNGLKVPSTWAELEGNAKALTGGNRFGAMHPIGPDSATQWMSLGYLWAEDTKLLDDNFSLVLGDAPMKSRAADYFDHMKRLSDSMPPGMSQATFATAINQYAGDQVAHAPYAGRLMEVLEQRNPEMADNTGFFMYPDSSGKNKAVNHGYDGWVIVDTPQKEESLKFMEWFTENRFVDYLHSSPLHFQPARLDIYDNDQWRSNPLIQKHSEMVGFMKSMLTRDDVIIRSIDTAGPKPDVRPGKLFQSFAMAEALQMRILQDASANEAVEHCVSAYQRILQG